MSDSQQMHITLYKEYYDRALERAKTRKAKYYKTVRQSTVEPVFGTLINFMGMRKINTRGIESANKAMLMAAIAYNLKKYMKFKVPDARNTAVQIKTFFFAEMELIKAILSPFLNFEKLNLIC